MQEDGCIRRRDLIAVFGWSMLGPTLARAQPQPISKVPRIGYLVSRSPLPFDDAFVNGLRDLGYIDGQSIFIEYRYDNGQSDKLPALAADLVARHVDLIVTNNTQAGRAAKAASQVIPIVIATDQTGVADGLVESLAHPGGNITGNSVFTPELAGKRLELAKALLPDLHRIGAVWNEKNPGAPAQFREMEQFARSLNIDIEPIAARLPEGIDEAYAIAKRSEAQAMFIISDNITVSNRTHFANASLQNRLPTICFSKLYLEAGGGTLMSYGVDFFDMFRHAAVYVDKILKGAKPGDLPMEQPTKFELVVSLRAAKALGIEVPPMLLGRADEVIE